MTDFYNVRVKRDLCNFPWSVFVPAQSAAEAISRALKLRNLTPDDGEALTATAERQSPAAPPDHPRDLLGLGSSAIVLQKDDGWKNLAWIGRNGAFEMAKINGDSRLMPRSVIGHIVAAAPYYNHDPLAFWTGAKFNQSFCGQWVEVDISIAIISTEDPKEAVLKEAVLLALMGRLHKGAEK
jgi:hypothetical protein